MWPPVNAAKPAIVALVGWVSVKMTPLPEGTASDIGVASGWQQCH
jgi:hypothetical protein